MTFNEFVEYMKENLSGYETFYDKVMEFQNKRNKNRQAAKRWNEEKLDRAVNDMWRQSMQGLYDKVRMELKGELADPYEAWVNFMEENEILDAVNEGMYDIDFDGE